MSHQRFKPLCKTARVGLTVLAIAGAATVAQAANVLTVGDSITFGYKSPGTGADVYGYQTTLTDLLGPNFNFVGEFQSFEAFSSVPWDPSNPIVYGDFMGTYGSHFGLPGATIQTTTSTLQNVPITTGTPGSPEPYTLSGQTLAQRLAPADQPDVIVVQIGTNNIASSGGISTELDATQIANLQNAHRALISELATQFTGSRIMVNLIPPKAYQFNGYQNEHRIIRNNIAAYNAALVDLVEDINTSGDPLFAQLGGKIAYNDLFKLTIADLAALGMSASLQTAVQADADPYVDWILNDDESELNSITNTARNENGNLFGDWIHPNDAGYEVMAYGIYGGLLNSGLLAGLIAGDLNGDGFVGQDDLNIILGAWGTNVTPGDLLAGDPSGDGFVSQDDLNVVLIGWSQGPPPPPAPLPEPGALAVLLGGGWLLINRRGVQLDSAV